MALNTISCEGSNLMSTVIHSGWYAGFALASVGVAVGVMSMSPPQHLIAKVFFTIAAALLLVRAAWWLHYDQESMSLLSSGLWAFLVFGLIGSSWLIAIKWVSANQAQFLDSISTKQRKTVPKQLAEPEFIINILGANMFVPDKKPNITGIAVDVTIRNAGAPSIAADWRMLVIDAKGKAIEAQLTKPPKRLSISGENGSFVLTDQDFTLESASSRKPLAIGDPLIQGQLLFYVSMPKSRVMAPDTTLEIFVNDYKGKASSMKKRIGEWPQL